ncbi:MAG: hypothetical protein U0263_09455 [Polyangiaceae bacterium]
MGLDQLPKAPPEPKPRNTPPTSRPTSGTKPPATSTKPPADNCDPPYTVDKNGVRRPKPACM